VAIHDGGFLTTGFVLAIDYQHHDADNS